MVPSLTAQSRQVRKLIRGCRVSVHERRTKDGAGLERQLQDVKKTSHNESEVVGNEAGRKPQYVVNIWPLVARQNLDNQITCHLVPVYCTEPLCYERAKKDLKKR